MTVALVAGLTSVAGIAATPAITAAAGAAKDALFPEPGPALAWTALAEVKAMEQPTLLDLRGDSLR